MRILVANNGLAAVKAITSLKRHAYTNNFSLHITVLCTQDDLTLNSEHMRLADCAILVPSGPSDKNYANINLICDVASRAHVDAVWVGWGHASENPALPQALSKLNITFIGPNAHAMHALGCKISATIIAQSANVPCVNWSGSDIKLPDIPNDEIGTLKVPKDLFDKACIHSIQQGLDHAIRIGFPVMIKASEGGGGKGIRIVNEKSQFSQAYYQVIHEVPSSPVFVMQVVRNARHLEVQLLADKYGNCIALFGRDCSVQRRHQKIIEEAPISIAPPEILNEMEASAIRLAKLVGYTSAGTVEYLYDPSIQKFYFLELNPRLQVEHPCTEMITGVNLPAAQLEIAFGAKLSNIKDIRVMYGLPPNGDSDIDFEFKDGVDSLKVQRKPKPKGFVVSTRITAENPDAGFKPNTGKVLELNFRSNPNCWGYFSVNALRGNGVHQYADSQFGHIFSYGETRSQARKNLVVALKDLSIRGEFRNTTEYLQMLLEHPDYVNDLFNTEWLDGLISNSLQQQQLNHTRKSSEKSNSQKDDEFSLLETKSGMKTFENEDGDDIIDEMLLEKNQELARIVICGSAAIAFQHFQTQKQAFYSLLSKGQSPIADENLISTSLKVGFVLFGSISFKTEVFLTGPETISLHTCCNQNDNVSKAADCSVASKPAVDGFTTAPQLCSSFSSATMVNSEDYKLYDDGAVDVIVKQLPDNGLLIQLGDKSHVVYVTKQDSLGSQLVLDGKTCHLESDEQDPTVIRTQSPGKLARLLVKNGDHVNIGDSVAEIEVMKMYLPLVAREAGRFTALKSVGCMLNSGDVIGSLVLDDPNKVKIAAIFTGRLPKFTTLSGYGDKLHQRVLGLVESANNILKGYESKHLDVPFLLKTLFDTLKNADLPFLEFDDIMASILSRIPPKVGLLLQDGVALGKTNPFFNTADLEIQLGNCIDSLCLPSDDQNVALLEHLAPVYAWITKYKNGTLGFIQTVISDLLEQYHSIEVYFTGPSTSSADVMGRWRHEFSNDPNAIYDLALASSKRSSRSKLIISLLDIIQKENNEIEEESTTAIDLLIEKLANLKGSNSVAIKSRQLLMLQHQPSFKYRYSKMLSILEKSVAMMDNGNNGFVIDQQVLASLIAANYSIVDVLSEFFINPKVEITAAALYTYVLHTFQEYSITHIEILNQSISQLKNVALFWKFAPRTEELNGSRCGLILALDSVNQIKDNIRCFLFEKPFLDYKNHGSSENLGGHVIAIAVNTCSELETDAKAHAFFSEIVQSFKEALDDMFIKRITFIVLQHAQFPRYFNFSDSRGFEEDLIARHIEPAVAHKLELERLSNFELRPCHFGNRRFHIFHASAKENFADSRFFIRGVIRPKLATSTIVTTYDFLMSEGARIVMDILDTMEIVSTQYPQTDSNHLFLRFIPILELEMEQIEKCLREIMRTFAQRLFKLRITEAEILFKRRSAPGQIAKPVRYIVSSYSGFVIHSSLYLEMRDMMGAMTLISVSSPPGPLHNTPSNAIYTIIEPIQPKRYKAHLMGTTYIYDFPELFEGAIKRQWTSYHDTEGLKPPGTLIKMTELVLNRYGELEPTSRDPGNNTCGIVVWEMELYTPEYPEGRSVIIIGNDITFQMGSFGPTEDLAFLKASQMARRKGIPRIYISANSGARIGLATEVSEKFKIAWKNDDAPELGFDYLYLTEGDFASLNSNPDSKSVIAERIIVNGETRYRLTSVIGLEHGIGVENLRGSGQIAGETSRAYNEIFTINLVTCRSVGIGAYLVRLGQRTVQVEGAPIILTGANALNKVYGRKVYTSNLQIGGTQIMHRNGVSHLIASNDLEAVVEIIQWISYVPRKHGAPLPVRSTNDSIERPISIPLTEENLDPRVLLTGRFGSDGVWSGGFFDRNSFRETLSGWAKGVIVGRARLGGIPVGVIVTESRQSESVEVADPSVETSQEQVHSQPGQVWHPNSAFKTAQAIKDFNNGEQLPLIIFANWRGFAGGQSDMYKEVLKFGAFIVDALVDFKQPVFVYLIGELRGGAWVVLDSSINPNVMEMYAQEEARGGIIEPPGIVEIKFRTPKLRAAMDRLDPRYHEINSKINAAKEINDHSEAAKLKGMLEERAKELHATYLQAAEQFADLHDTPGRMMAKETLNGVVPWCRSRHFFYWKLLRKITEATHVRNIISADDEFDVSKARETLAEWFVKDTKITLKPPQSPLTLFQTRDKKVLHWMNTALSHIDDGINKLKRNRLLRESQRIANSLAALSDTSKRE